jgi:hypothetical protein
MKPPHHQNNGQAIKEYHKELSQAWVVGLNSLVEWEEGIDGLVLVFKFLVYEFWGPRP